MNFKSLIFFSLLFLSVRALSQQISFVTVPAGTYRIGAKNSLVNPRRKIKLAAFEIATTEITNQQFAAFVDATGYVTDAEKWHRAQVFEPGLDEFKWIEDTTAFWRFPNGISRGGIDSKMNHPVTAISFFDAQAYCEWAGYRLPTLEEWEVASRAGAGTIYFWGKDKEKIRKYANIWWGKNHLVADTSDGFMYTSPVASFKPNPWGLYDVYGNVFEFCAGNIVFDTEKTKLIHARGGSWWCSRNSCNFFNSVDIGGQNGHASFSNQGFRVVRNSR